MERRRFLSLMGAYGMGLAPAPRPNIILAMADDQGWGDTSYNGHPVLQTPNLDSMARNGVRFDRFYAASPVCSPTRGSCLTGRHPFRYGIFFANADTGTDAPSKYALPARELTVAELVKPLGYATGHFGKWHLGDFEGPRRSSPADNGFDVFFSTTRKVPTVDPEGYWTREGRVPGVLRGDDSELMMSRAIEFIRAAAARQQPFLAVIWFHAPHVPFLALPRHRAPYGAHSESKQHYWGSIASIDEQMGRLRSTLDQLGLRKNTMLWYASDNGPEGDQQQDSSPGSAGPWRGRKRSLFEGGVRVPGLLEWPERFPRPVTVTSAASTSDYFPSIASALGLAPAQSELDGINLWPLIDDPSRPRRSALGFETIGDTRGSPRLAYIEDRWKLLSNLDDTPDLLFDLAKDPSEANNLAPRHPQEVRRMRASLEKWRKSCEASRADLKP